MWMAMAWGMAIEPRIEPMATSWYGSDRGRGTSQVTARPMMPTTTNAGPTTGAAVHDGHHPQRLIPPVSTASQTRLHALRSITAPAPAGSSPASDGADGGATA